MPGLLVTTTFAFAGFAVLMPVSPMHVVALGGNEFLAGLTNAVLMGATILTQLNVERMRARLGWSITLALGCLLLGAPSLLEILVTDAWQVIALAGVRGIGFGIITVSGASAVAALFAPGRRGRAIGMYGLAVAAPQLALTPTAPFVAETVSFAAALLLGALPLVGVPFAIVAGRGITAHARTFDAAPEPSRDDHTDAGVPPTTGGLALARAGVRRALLRMLPSIIALTAVTCAGGAITTFTPQFAPGATLTFAALFGFTAVAALARWLIGGPADRFGARVFILPGLGLAVLGTGAIAASLVMDAPSIRPLLIVGGALLTGAAFGGLQNVTLVRAFELAGERARGTASTAWNVAFDAGTGVGALAIGAIAASTSFGIAFVLLAGMCLAVMISLWIATGRDRDPGRPART